MKIKALVFSAAVGSLLFSASGRMEVLDFRYWYDAQLPLPDGWTHSMLDKGALSGDWKGGAYFDTKEGWLLSPVFDADIRTVMLSVATTLSPARHLYLHPIANGRTNEQGRAVSETEDRTYVEQEFSGFPDGTRQFVLKFDKDGTTGNWGMIRIVVRYGDASTDDEVKPLRSWSVSEIVRESGCHRADFTMLRDVRPGVTTPWKNGVSIDGFHAFADSDSCTEIHCATNFSPATYGLYSLAVTNGDLKVRTLAMRGTSGKAMSLMLPIALDAGWRVRRLSIGYRVWAPTAESESILSFSCRTLDDLAQMNDLSAAGETVAVSVDADGRCFADVPPRALRGSRFICFCWSLPKVPNNPAIGISDVCVSAELLPSGFSVIIK